MRERINIGQAAKGRWLHILPALGVDAKYLVNRHGPCPVCGGRDRFRWDDKEGKGTYFCSGCGSGDGLSLLMALHGWDFKQAAREVEQQLGLVQDQPIRVRAGPDVDQVKREMAELWRKGVDLPRVRGTALWWAMRIGTIPICEDLRGTDQLSYPGRRELFHGMLAKVRDAEGRWINMHRTFLTPLGEKADLPEVRMVMPLTLPKGCAVRLGPIAAVMGVAEGIETAVAVTELFGMPCWATLTANNMTGFAPPAGCERLVIFGDNDTSLTGHWAAYSLGRKLRTQKDPFPCEVKLPEVEGHDWNDVLVTQREREGA